MEKVDRTARFLTSRGLTQTQALRAISLHVMLSSYSHEMMESKIQWLSTLGLSHEKINDVIVRHPNVLGLAFDRLDALVDWYISHGVSQEKMAYVFNVFPAGVSLSIEENLDVKVDFLKEEVGCSYDQVARILTAAPQMLACSLERLQTNVRCLEELGVPSDKLPAMIALVPQCLNLKSTRIKETVDAMDEMFGSGAGIEALIKNCRIVMHNISGMRRSYKYLLSVGFTKERLEQNTRFLMRNANRLLRPRVQFLKSKGVDVVDDVSWILMPEGRFVHKYPDYSARLKKNM
ncbi:putative mitochondrial protein [Phytophthora megakarya]|uniref:Putative mitochondrial protein n=1 Tax=Phytophthora megakarya TaxID=4795 RepID=A0A225WVC6_9STRA|nr:putative mitochondrial protein [Phytophthora megakarya]